MVFSSKLVANLDALFGLRTRVCKRGEMWRCGSTIRITGVREAVLRSPEQLDSCLLLFHQHHVAQHVQVLLVLLEGISKGRHVDIMEAIVRNTELAVELESHIHASLEGLHRGILVPRPYMCLHITERVGAHAAVEGVPPGDSESQPFLHGLAHQNFILVVVLEGERIQTFWPFVFDLGDAGEVLGPRFLCRAASRGKSWMSVRHGLSLARKSQAGMQELADRSSPSETEST
mmetsp:Transcript_144292/g.268941  ORF Transcript_144292/g.268941 Transcript_144292/m.268941 type:complete len:232 (+) Transcript_144292:887-1582(+)